MDKVRGKLTVYFEEPFWVGVFERIEDGKLSVSKVTFGAEPVSYTHLDVYKRQGKAVIHSRRTGCRKPASDLPGLFQRRCPTGVSF